MSELDSAFTFVRQLLKNDATLAAAVGGRIYEDQAPDGESPVYPLIIIAFGEPDDMTGVNGQRCGVSVETLVYVVGKGSSTALPLLADRIDALLHGAGGGQVITITRERPLRRSGWQDKVLYRNLGGAYRLEIGV